MSPLYGAYNVFYSYVVIQYSSNVTVNLVDADDESGQFNHEYHFHSCPVQSSPVWVDTHVS